MGLPLPQKKMQVIRVEEIDVGGLARAFSGGPESRLAQPPDFLQAPRHLRRPRVLDQVLAALDEALVRRKRFDFSLEKCLRDRRRDGLLIDLRRASGGKPRRSETGHHALQAVLDETD